MDSWCVALLVVAGYMAITSLVGLMIRRRDQMLERFRQEMERERRRKEAEKRRQEQIQSMWPGEAA
jgi:hypothetical protein